MAKKKTLKEIMQPPQEVSNLLKPMAKKKTLKEIMQPPQEVSNLLKPKPAEVQPTPEPLPKGFIPDPTNVNQMIKPGTPNETRATPEYALLARAKARAEGNVPLPPETKAEKDVVESIPPTPEQIQQAGLLGTLTKEQKEREVVKGEGIAGELATGGAAIAGGVAGLKVGAVGGLAVGGPLGALVGGIGGMLVGGGAAVFAKVSYQKRQDVKQAYAVYTQSKSNMNWIINQVNAGKMSPVQAHEMWDEELANLYSAERNLKKDTHSSMDRYLSGGADEMSKLEAFKRRLPYLQLQLKTAIQHPNPNSIINEIPEE